MEVGENGALRFAVIAEIHGAPAGTPRVSWHNEMLLDRSDELLALALDRLAAQRIDSIVLLGDLTSSADDASFVSVLDMTTKNGRSILAVPGNHDSYDEASLARYAAQMRGPNVSSAPLCITARDNMTIILVSIERDPSSGELHSAGFPDLSPFQGQTLIVFSHYPLLAMKPRLSDAGLKHSGDLTDRQTIADRLLRHDGAVIVIHGHLHVRAAAVERNVLHLSCAALIEAPHEVTVVAVARFDTGELVVGFDAKSVMTSDVQRMPVLDDPIQDWRFKNGNWRRLST